MTHPSGATGVFTFEPTRHIRSNITYAQACRIVEGELQYGPPHESDNYALTGKTLSGPAMLPMQWAVSYATGCAACTSKAVTVTNPGQSVTRHTFGTRFYLDEGKLLITETLDAAGALLRHELIAYATNPSNPPYAYVVGWNGMTNEDAFSSTRVVPETQRTISQQGVTFQSTVTGFDSYARPLGVTKASSLGYTKTDTTVYTGHVYDAATGLNYMQQRYYDPGIGRFLSVDPVTADGNTGGNFNRYWYAANNPYRYIDPDGRECTGSHITNSDGNCASTGEHTTMARTAAEPQTISASMVKSVGPTQATQGQVNTAVKDANAVGRTAKAAGDSRALRAFNKIAGIKIDGSNWDVATYTGGSIPRTSIAFAEYGGKETGAIVLNASRYFDVSRNDYDRAFRFMHETFHFDTVFDDLKVRQNNECRSACEGWGYQFEKDVEATARVTMLNGWGK